MPNMVVKVSPGIAITAGNSFIGAVSVTGTVAVKYVARDSAGTAVSPNADVLPAADRFGRTVVVMNNASLVPSGSQGPKTVTLSTSANTVLCASQGAACIYVNTIMVTGALAALTRVDLYTTTNSAAPEVSAFVPTTGQPIMMEFNPPWKISAGQALSGRLKPSASAQVLVTVHFTTGAT